MPYNPDVHHRRSIRLQHYDYAKPGSYFVTICVYQKRWVFGEIANDSVCLNGAGKIAHESWLALSRQFPYIEFDEYIIMPNHVHSIITIPETQSAPGQQPPTLGHIIRAFKATTTSQIRSTCTPEFAWQRNYYEHIIRKNGELDQIRQYIIDNPLRWSLRHQSP